MKFRSLFILLLILTFILTPLAALRFAPVDVEANQPDTTTTAPSKVSPTSTATAPKAETVTSTKDFTVRLLRSVSGKTEELPLEDYVLGALAAEMPASNEPEALAAQAVAVRTNALYARNHPDATLAGADLADTAGTHQGYADKTQRQAQWGKDADIYEEKLTKVVADTAGKIVLYKDKPAFAAFHALSCGMTESAANVWGNDLPYLRPVNSAGDTLSPNYAKTIIVPIADFLEKVAQLGGDKNAKELVGKATLTASGTVAGLKLGGKELKGTEIRTAFALPSAAFDLTLTQTEASFACRGYGHGVGLSQFGAQTMAAQGSNWREILAHYYPGTTI
ncbi:MAG: stage II sporulation protein D [Oscillospiraceae bacterium]|jgi:stage II sporulation protein D|nr:stage II sporulation protein D [Oscillospiraceae bacterium]